MQQIIDQILNQNKNEINEYKKLKKKLGFFIGKVMKEHPEFDPLIVNNIMQKKFGLALTDFEIENFVSEYGVTKEYVLQISQILTEKLK